MQIARGHIARHRVAEDACRGGRLIGAAKLGHKAREAPRELIVVLVTFALTFATDLLIGVAGGWIVAALLRVRAGETE